MTKESIYDYTIEQWNNWLAENNEPLFRAKQIFDWLYVKRVKSFKEMTNLSIELRKKLDEDFNFQTFSLVDSLSSTDTVKFLYKLEDDQVIETVILKHDYGNSICVSTQVGCKMGCTFCASSIGGLRRNLSSGEIVLQVLQSQRFLDKKNEKINSIVIMGTGEPFDNYDETIKFINIINNRNGLNIGQRHITLSTSGIVPYIYKFADLNNQIVLAISLHAPNNNLRSKIMPINKKYPLEDLMDACYYYVDKTNRRITFEYALIKDLNDSEENAIELGELLGNIKCHVNLIPMNQVLENEYLPSSNNKLFLFKKVLENLNINTTIRRERGKEIDAACGQLRAKYIK